MSALLKPRFWTVFAGVLLMQLAWILVLPPFGGIDEHDHVLKAYAVAHGDFSPHHDASPQGWGEFVDVPASLARAGEPECSVLHYTHFDNCFGTENADGTIHIATSAARYNPAYYAVVGTVGRFFDGDTALYVMRACTSMLFALLIAAAFLVTRSWSRTSWPPVVLVLALTPTALYSSMVVAPNGVEMAAGLLLWTCLLGLRSDAPGRLRTEALLLTAAVASVPLLAVRTLGPLWWLLIVVGGVLTIGLPRARNLVHLKAARWFAAVAAVAGAYGAGWSLIARSNGFVDEQSTSGSPWPDMFTQWILWFLQTIAAAPLRNEFVPIVVYGIAVTVIGLTTVAALTSATTRLRLTILYVVLAASGVGIAASVAAYAASGYAWQGRYAFPFTIGFFALLGVALDRGPKRFAVDPRFGAAVIGVCLATTQVISQVAVRDRNVKTSRLVETGQWHVPSTALLILLTVAGTALLIGAILRGHHGLRPDDERESQADLALLR